MSNSGVITIDYNTTPRERREASAALAVPRWPVGQPLPSPSRARGLLGWALFAGCALLLYVLKRSEGTDLIVATWDIATRHPLASGAAAGAAAVVLLMFLWMKRIVDRNVRSYRSRMTFDAAGITERTAAGETVERPWSNFTAWVETDNLLLVRGTVEGATSGPVALYFPKRLFASERTVEAMKRLFAENIRPV